MGYMTEISILNDGWHNIKSDPERFIERISQGMHWDGDVRDRTLGGVTVHPSHHADDTRVYWAGRNSFVQLNRYSLEEQFKGRIGGVDREGKPDFIHDVLLTEINDALRQLEDAKKYVLEQHAHANYHNIPKPT